MQYLYFIPNDPESTTLVSPKGVAQYRVLTSKAAAILRSPAVTRISRNSGDASTTTTIGVVEWRKWCGHPVVRSTVFDGNEQKIAVRELLYKLGSTFSTYVPFPHKSHWVLTYAACRARFFLGNDNEEYRWKYSRGHGYVVRTCILTSVLRVN